MPPEGMRRSSRIPREIAILLVGSDMEGKMFSEQTKTVLLSRHGAGIVSQYALSAEQELILRRLDTDKEAEVRVVGNLGAHGKSYTYGVAFVNRRRTSGHQVSSMTESEREASRVLLQCSSCKARETVEQSDLESDVYIVNEGIVRTCKSCGSSTYWRRAVDDASGEPVPVEIAPPEVRKQRNLLKCSRPRHRRQSPQYSPRAHRKQTQARAHQSEFQSMHPKLCFGDDIVTCEDICRGGLRFKSRKEYVPEAEIEVAVPYSPVHSPFLSVRRSFTSRN